MSLHARGGIEASKRSSSASLPQVREHDDDDDDDPAHEICTPVE